ncbi:hypothetical protein A1OO_08220 [Enterovibrio norvegicus FF-33]|uniref:DUF3634 family protein n=1 Tax=Enterovibrio norvegicus TaxID=188144 RepID=UPI000307D7FF|nr:DUF3634 family protein [Enterovibrio norvegicus]OEE65786.1 hypothetical protein A1OO_08220 [Enterovibrio norvegicus FF-33]
MEYFLAGSFIALFVFIAIDRPILLIKFKDGEIIKTRGKIPHGLLHDCAEIAKRNPITGTVEVYRNRFKPVKLVISKSIDNKAQQRIRNVFPYKSFK